MSVITLLTDFGISSPYVAEMKGVLLALNPAATLIDITHGIPPQDIRTAAFVLDQVYARFPLGTIHICVVDPGVGTRRELVFVELGGHGFLGPNNGLFSRIALRQAPERIFVLSDRQYWLADVSATFHGRDILAPVAARLSLGLDPALLGPPRHTLLELDWPQPRLGSRHVEGQVQAIDSFGNLITNIDQRHLHHVASPSTAVVTCGTQSTTGLAHAYGDRPVGSLVALVGSGGYLELALVNGNAAAKLGLASGAPVRIEW
jgi:S-adenosylmethionine hydrolase